MQKKKCLEMHASRGMRLSAHCEAVQPTLDKVVVCYLQFTGPNVVPFSLERENLILSTWQVQQSGQDFRIKLVRVYQ